MLPPLLMGRRLKVLMTSDVVGGVWTYALDLARGLADHRVETILAVLGPSPSAGQRQAALDVPGLALVETGLPLDWVAGEPGDVLDAGRSLADLAGEHGVDLVHLNSPALAAGGAFAHPLVGICHSCVATWWDAVHGGPLPEDFRWRADLVRSGYARCDSLVAPSAAFASVTAGSYDLRQAPIIVHNGRSSSRRTRLSKLDAPDAEVAGLAIPQVEEGDETAPRPFVLTAGRLWDEGKNLATLDRAAEALAIPVFAAGSVAGPNGAAIALRYVRSLGFVPGDELERLYGQRPIFASLAQYEPFGLAVLEAAQAGCPLVLSDIPSFRELWDGAAIFVPPDDHDAVAAAITGLAADASRHASLGREACIRAGRYTVERMTLGMLEVYGRLARPRKHAPKAAALAGARP